ncbi:MAG TPA: vWA domain-containing protein [Thermoplasmata archaeon]|nr:vWA domain-containing protein [Thermoplasmata archaeon]
MANSFRDDSEGVASTVATLFALLAAVLFLQAAVISVIPAREYAAERQTSIAALQALDYLRYAAVGAAVPGGQFSFTIPLGTPSSSAFSTPSDGTLQFNTGTVAPANITMQYVPTIHDSRITHVDQDVILAIDSSGSMQQNDPSRLRITAAKEYIGRLTRPDRVASVDFDSLAWLTRQNVGGPAHHLFSAYNNGIPDYSGAQADLDTIDQSGSTNFGAALFVANNELISYGVRSHAWAIILLTDGQNTCCPNKAAGDAQARFEAARAKANNITVFTIGLGPGADGALLQEIATTTGGTYYAAPNAESIRFIYLEIANHYSGSVSCGTLTTASSVSGSLVLNRGNRQYPVQTMSLEAGGVTLSQAGGSVIHQGIPFEYTPRDKGTGSLRLTLITFVGDPFRAAGSDYAFINAQFLYANTNTQTIIRPDLGDQAQGVGNTSAYVQFWASQGAATPGAATAVRQPLNRAQARLQWGDVNASAGKLALAKFNVDSAQSQLSAAVTATNQQVAAGNMQAWLGKSINDQIFFVACLLTQWVNWYAGITLTIQSPSAVAWALWFTDAFRPTGALTTFGTSGNTVVLTVNAIDRFIVDERVIELSTS